VADHYTIDEVASKLRVGKRTIERQIAAGRIRVIRIGRRVFITELELEAYVASLRGRRVA
jgi:excisionase family DNA binding protein